LEEGPGECATLSPNSKNAGKKKKIPSVPVHSLITCLELQANNPFYWMLDGKKTLDEELRFKEIIEFPTIIVAMPEEESNFPLKPPSIAPPPKEAPSETPAEALPPTEPQGLSEPQPETKMVFF
jgi:hypothetical protein